ncbi:uncharacterized protein EI90DRAFT_1107255 [Cantharellus anzutake]|uniref:uncharacterized protein n=1 Tax=Cantharellus anzutake TaxID=1750568 RepID=UPI001908C106|nr:uncharacterized protein EI90DRAFT_1107255 [Cantharellus anzutake]KAF8330878.1 hypothetical protein EI90DRAFT_1107255 [Cantharellus anzutake]
MVKIFCLVLPFVALAASASASALPNTLNSVSLIKERDTKGICMGNVEGIALGGCLGNLESLDGTCFAKFLAVKLLCHGNGHDLDGSCAAAIEAINVWCGGCVKPFTPPTIICSETLPPITT